MSAADVPYDVFLSHDHADAEAVEDLGNVLRIDFGFRVWLDRWQCVPGSSWQADIAKGLSQAASCAVCIGKRTARGWFQAEIERALDRQATDPRFRVIPVLLPDAVLDDEEFLFGFVRLRTWADFRPGSRDPRALHLLRHGVLGTAPGPWPPLPERPADAVLDEVKHDLSALEQLTALLHEDVVIETQRRIVSRRFP